MSDWVDRSEEAGQMEAREEVASATPVVVAVKKRSMWDDPVVKVMGFALAALIIFYLAALVSAFYFGLIGNPAPRTFAEREVMAWESAVGAENATLEQWQSYILALIGDRQFQRAQQLIDQIDTEGVYDQTRGANMRYCSARLEAAQGDRAGALETYEEAMASMVEAYETELARGGDENWAISFGRHENYYLSALERAALLREQDRLDEAIEMIDIYLESFPTHSGVIIDRAALKEQTGDLAGAEADYREALRFVADNPEALAGLERIGVDD